MFRSILLFFFFLGSFSFVGAQQLASLEKNHMEVISLHTANTDWSFYADEENKLYYLDFEMFNFNLKEILIKDSKNKIVQKENVSDLPVDTIYELDFNELPSGEYSVELHSFNGLLVKKVKI